MNKIKHIGQSIRMFFPIHLLVSHFKFNIIVIFYWLFLFAIINGYFGLNFGLQYLFLSPEYLGETGFLSFFILGFSIGGFVMAFNTYSYIRLGPKYPFIATIARPFFKFCINNSLLPLLFSVNLLFNILLFQKTQELASISTMLIIGLSFTIGVIFFFTLSFLYFFPTNKDLFKLTGKQESDFENTQSNIQSALHKKQQWYNEFLKEHKEQYFYFGKQFKLRKSRDCTHYDISVLQSVFAQNHTNASYFELALLLSFITIGFFKDYEVFQVPASVSIMLLLTMIVMIVSAFFSWFKRWTYPIFILIFVLINNLSKSTDLFSFQSFAFGLSYKEANMRNFDVQSLTDLGFDAEQAAIDRDYYLRLMDNWKSKQLEEKPKLIIVNTSGGGLRSAMWTFSMFQLLDHQTKNLFSKQTQLITGASGGMLGAAYYRDLMLMEQQGEITDKLATRYRDNISKDLLNRVAFSISTSDIFFRFQKFEVNGQKYTKDRGYAFEQELVKNLEGALDHNLGYYSQEEFNGNIPTMIFSPTIINDGRRLIVSSQHLSFLNDVFLGTRNTGLSPEIENVEYLKYFADNEPENLRFTSVIRMNATFPYIMPMVTMPTRPGMQVMDAGIRDNYGTKISVQYLISLNNWIKENTSGVIIVRLRDTKKVLQNETYRDLGMFNKLLLPFGNMYGNFPRVQDFDQDQLYSSLLRSKDYPIDFVTFNLRERAEDIIALSWHLTRNEKNRIINNLNSANNLSELSRLKRLMGISDE
jgi:hypothetical protein